MIFRRKNLVILLLAICLIWLIYSIFSSSNISISRSEDNSKIVFSAKFPNAECNKTFKRDFPFFEFKCTRITEQTEYSETSDKSNRKTETKEKLDSSDKQEE